MATLEISSKRIAISKANAQMVIFVAVACFLTVFSLVASNSILSQNNYQARLITAKDAANKQLQSNIQAFSSLQSSYNQFVSASTNIIGGTSGGTAQNDGTNDKIVLDSLPSTYDYPALASSVENILSAQGLQISSISGTDEQLTEQSNTSSPDPQPVQMPISFSVTGTSYASIELLISKLQQSIRPFSIDTLTLSGSNNDMTLLVTAHSFYQPSKSLQIKSETVK